MSDIPFSVRGNLTSLDRLKDVNIENVVNSQVLQYNSLEQEWINSNPSSAQVVLDTPVIASPSNTGNLTLTNGTGINNLLTLTPPDKNNINGIVNITGDFTANNFIANNINVDNLDCNLTAVFSDKIEATGTSTIQDLNCVNLTSTGNINANSMSTTAIQINDYNTGTFVCNDLQIIGQGFGGAINWVGQTIWLRTSDSRLKWNQYPIKNGLETIMKLKPKTYEATDKILDEKPDDAKKSAGFIAQDIKEIPELSHLCQDNCLDDNILSLDYGAIYTYSISAVQELNEKLKIKKEKVSTLENIINNIMIKIK